MNHNALVTLVCQIMGSGSSRMDSMHSAHTWRPSSIGDSCRARPWLHGQDFERIIAWQEQVVLTTQRRASRSEYLWLRFTPHYCSSLP